MHTTTLRKFMTATEKQLQGTSFKNIFCTETILFHFTAHTKKQVLSGRQELRNLSVMDKETLTQFYVDNLLKILYGLNQYLNFSPTDLLSIRNMYALLLEDICNECLSLSKIEARHDERVWDLLKSTNPALYQLNHNSNIAAKQFICAEYSAEFQLDLFGIELGALQEPILDIGCGEHGWLVEYLHNHHLNAFGIDRLHENGAYYKNQDWLEFDYGLEKWGTVLANLSFSNHFINHFAQNDQLDLVYAQIYMKILKGLSIGGTWFYAPSVPFIEKLLSPDQYHLCRSPINDAFTKTIIVKIK